MPRPLVLLALAVALGACDRPRVDPVGVTLLAAEPDLGVVRLTPDLALRLTPVALDGRLDLTLNGEAVAFDSSAGAFVVRTTLEVGLNPLHLALTDDEGVVRHDTLYAVHLPIQRDALLSGEMAVARVGAAAARLPDDQIAVTGGVGATGEALASATLLQPGGTRIPSREVTLASARAGHTASALPDGRVLLLGGVVTDQPTGPADFVHTAEVVGLRGESEGLVEVEGDVARAGHTAHVLTADGATYVYLYGGRVPAGSGTALSGTVDVYRVEAGPTNRLVRLTPAGGAGAFEALFGHVQVPLGPRSAVVLGRGRSGGPAAAVLEWRLPGTEAYPFDLRRRTLPEVEGTRVGAAAVGLGAASGSSELALVIGGRTGGEPLGTLVVVAPAEGRSFRLPAEVGLATPRAGHTATILTGGRIVVSGGRNASGAVLPTLEAFQL